MKLLSVCLLALCITSSVQARSNFVSNPDLPYPPGCAGDPARTLVPFLSDAVVLLRDVAHDQELEVKLDGYRSTCSEPGRSLIWLRFDAVQHGNLNFRLELPGVSVTPATGGVRLMTLAASVNGWGLDSDPQLGRQYLANTVLPNVPAPTEMSWLYVLDNATPMAAHPGGLLSAEDYNGALSVQLVYPPDTILSSFHVPATADLIGTESGIPLSGRLSGIWVIPEAEDQGIAISISNRVGTDTSANASRDDLPLVLFLAQYTYDSEGNLLWLTGSADFEQGSNEISLNMLRVQGGEFMGDKPASREPAGTVRLIANSCNDITFEFDYAKLGMGSGSYRLERLFSLEIAGYDCRDYEARVAANR